MVFFLLGSIPRQVERSVFSLLIIICFAGFLIILVSDSAGECWRALEPHKVLRLSKEYFRAWLEGYRSVRPFKKLDEDAVAAFGIIGDLRVIAWDLGVATSSRGTPKIGIPELTKIADGWLDWERKNII